MSFYAVESKTSRASAQADPAEARRRARWPWVWMGLACLLLTGSTAVRSWQDRRFANAEVHSVAPTFPLKELPKRFGNWRLAEGAEAALDPKIARIAGSSDSLIRCYEDETTGVTLTLLVLYGSAERVSGHTPEVCYPAVGYEQVEEPGDVPLKVGPIETVFRSVLYSRKGASVDREEVYYAFRQQGAWTPAVEGNWKSLSVDPSLYKVQIQRRVAEHEQRHLYNPTENFLSKLLPELERRIATGVKGGPPASGSK